MKQFHRSDYFVDARTLFFADSHTPHQCRQRFLSRARRSIDEALRFTNGIPGFIISSRSLNCAIRRCQIYKNYGFHVQFEQKILRTL